MYLCLNCQNRLHSTRCSGFGSLMNIDNLILDSIGALVSEVLAL